MEQICAVLGRMHLKRSEKVRKIIIGGVYYSDARHKNAEKINNILTVNMNRNLKNDLLFQLILFSSMPFLLILACFSCHLEDEIQSFLIWCKSDNSFHLNSEDKFSLFSNLLITYNISFSC
jgi:hypothetical protein